MARGRFRHEHLEPVTEDHNSARPGVAPDASQHQPKVHEALRKWRTAEQRLYPLALAWPEGFEKHVAMVRIIADRLGGVRTVDGLVDAYADWQAVASAALGEDPIDMLGMDLELTAGAAFYLRHQEITSELRRQESVNAIALARERGDEWVVVHQSSSPTGLPYPPWRRLEMHLPDGAAIHQWVEQSLEGADVEFGVEVVALNPETGRWLDDRPARDRDVTSSYEQWLDSVERLKARAGTGGVETPAERGA